VPGSSLSSSSAGERDAKAGPRNLVLIGMRASGKTTLGRELARRLGRPFADLDEELARLAGEESAGADAVLARRGEAAFRELEAEVLRRASRRAGHVIATGGGAVLHGEAFAGLAATGTVVWLSASLATLQARAALRPRPALTPLPPADEVAELLRRREPLYRSAAQIVVSTDEGEPILALLSAIRDRE
jgi:shikimate kinase